MYDGWFLHQKFTSRLHTGLSQWFALSKLKANITIQPGARPIKYYFTQINLASRALRRRDHFLNNTVSFFVCTITTEAWWRHLPNRGVDRAICVCIEPQQWVLIGFGFSIICTSHTSYRSTRVTQTFCFWPTTHRFQFLSSAIIVCCWKMENNMES